MRTAFALVLAAALLLLAAMPLAAATPPTPPAAHPRHHGPGPGPGPGHHGPFQGHSGNATLLDRLPREVMRTVGPPGALLIETGIVDPRHHGPLDPVEPLLMQTTRLAFRETMHALFLLADLSHQLPETDGARGFALERLRSVPDGAALPQPALEPAPTATLAPPLPTPLGDAAHGALATLPLPVHVLPEVPDAQVAPPAPDLPAPGPAPQPAPLQRPPTPCLGAGLDLGCLGLSFNGEAGRTIETTQARASPPDDATGEPGRVGADAPARGSGLEGDVLPGAPAPPATLAGQSPSASALADAPAPQAWRDAAVLSLASAALLAPFLALYRRIAREACLRSERRRSIFERIRAAPGMTLHELARSEGVAYPTVQHHARILESLGYVETWRDGARLHLFENGGRYSAGEKRLHVVAASPASAALEAVRARPGTGPAEVSRTLGVSRGTARFHLLRLAERGLVRLERAEGRVRAWPAAVP